MKRKDWISLFLGALVMLAILGSNWYESDKQVEQYDRTFAAGR